jgi:dTDP-4-dehydrorhamnose reductase
VVEFITEDFTMRSLILGASGQLGSQIVAECEHHDHIIQGTWYRWPTGDYLPLDICDEVAVQTVVADFEPETVFLAAGMTQLDFAESNPAECRAVNVDGVEQVVRSIENSDAVMVYFSTSHVFGECTTARKEDAATAPLNCYGRASVEAEELIRERLPNRHLIVRTSHVYGPEERGRNFVSHAMKRIASGNRVRAARDRFCQPTFGPDLAAATLDLLKHNCRGTYHIVGPDRVTEFSVLQMSAFIFGHDVDLVQSVEARDLGEEAPRARTLWLDRFQLRSTLGPKAVRGVGDGLRMLRDGQRIALPNVA